MKRWWIFLDQSVFFPKSRFDFQFATLPLLLARVSFFHFKKCLKSVSSDFHPAKSNTLQNKIKYLLLNIYFHNFSGLISPGRFQVLL